MTDFTSMDFNKSFEDILAAAKEELTQRSEQRRPIQLYGLGFYKLPIYTDRTQDGCAFHLWLEGLLSTPHHHTHIFDLDNLVLKGGIEDQTWTLKPSSNGTYEKRTFEGAADLRPSGEFFDLESKSKRLLTVGQNYSVDRGDFHTS